MSIKLLRKNEMFLGEKCTEGSTPNKKNLTPDLTTV